MKTLSHLITTPQIFRFASNRVDVPGVVWMPEGPPLGLVLACHGGSGHKLSPAIVAIADRLVPAGYAVASLDGPVHGERREDGNLDPNIAKESFRSAWRIGVGQLEIADDFTALLSVVRSKFPLANLPVAYIGVSMGTAYGIPLLARNTDICGAAIGLWSTTYPASEHLAPIAREICCPVWFTQQWDDEFFERSAVQALFDAIGSTDKRLVCYPGPHVELQGDRLEDAVVFLMRCLTRASAA